MINAAVNTNIDTPNSRAAMAMTQDQNLVKIIGGVNRAIEARGGDVKSASAKAMVDKAIMLYNQKSAKVTGMAEGGVTETTATTTPVEPDDVPTKTPEELANETNELVGQRSATAATNPTSLATKTAVTKVDTTDTGQKVDPITGQVSTISPTVLATTGVATTTDAPTTDLTPNLATTTSAEDATEQALKSVSAKTGTVSSDAKVTAATGTVSKTGTGDIEQITDISQVETPTKRVLEDDEKISGSAVDLAAVDKHLEITAATANPSKKATVKGQLDDLMDDFDGGATPAWAAGAMRAATAAMAARGLGASSMAGQAIIQATMESALPIAMADAQTTAGFEMQNLSNRQQRAMLAAQQRATFMGQEFDQAFQARVSNAAKISDVANMNFTAEQQVALENSRNANTVNLANLTNKQAMVLSEASAISQLESQNLSNQQQAAVQNANSFLQVDMANMNNAQQTSMFKAQSTVQSLLTDQAAENASRQFNASSENQTKQFMANLTTQANQFNAAQETAISQFNAGEENALDKFNASMEEQRNQFNAQNGLVVAQANAQWRQNVDTLNTAAQNEANMINAATINTFTKAAVDQIWQRERDLMDYAFKGSEQEKDRMVNIMLGEKEINAYITESEQKMKSNEDTAKYSILTQMILKI